MDTNPTRGISFIVEGSTEKVFYEEYLIFACAKLDILIEKLDTESDLSYLLTSETNSILVKFNSVDTISQMTNSSV